MRSTNTLLLIVLAVLLIVHAGVENFAPRHAANNAQKVVIAHQN